ncbi:MAG TPA: DUF427 domain-containing protein [Methylotenera sp.]|jgi:uncharacterized protein (DUF427 family)
MKAIWNDVVIAESDNTVVVEGNHYFPINAINPEYFTETQHTTTCGWKGLANYYSIQANGQDNANAAWVYKNPLKAAENIKNHVAFWKGVKVVS